MPIILDGTTGITTPGLTNSGSDSVVDLSVSGNTTIGDASSDNLTINGSATFATTNPTLTAGTANGVLYLNGSKVATSGSALTFDGSGIFSCTGSGLYPVISVAPTGNNAIFGFRMDASAGNGIDWRVEQGRSAVGDFNISAPAVTASPQYVILKDLSAQYWSVGAAGQKMRLTSAGLEIGGTFNQGRALNVDSAADGYTVSLLQTDASSSGKTSGIVFAGYYDGSSITDMASIRGGKENTTSGDYGGKLAFYTRPNGGADTERVRIASTGYVGINDTNPTTLLSLASGTATTLGLSITPSGWNNAKHRLTVPTQGDLSVWSFNYSGSAVDHSGYATSSIPVGQAYIAFAAGATNTAPVTIATIQPSGLNFPTPSSGNANIDYTATAMTLMVNSSSAALRFGTNSAERARFDTGGDFMIGTTSSSGRLTVVTGAGSQAALFSCGSGTTQQAVATFSNSTNGGYLSIAGVGTSSAVGTWTNGSMVVEGVPFSSGNTFIGSYTGDLVFQNGRSNSGRFNSGGNLLVGTDTALVS